MNFKFKISKKEKNNFKNYYLSDLVSGQVSNQITFRSKNGKCNILVEGFRPYKRYISYTVNFKDSKLATTWRINTKDSSTPVGLEPCLIPGLNQLVLKAAQKHHSLKGTITIKVQSIGTRMIKFILVPLIVYQNSISSSFT